MMTAPERNRAESNEIVLVGDGSDEIRETKAAFDAAGVDVTFRVVPRSDLTGESSRRRGTDESKFDLDADADLDLVLVDTTGPDTVACNVIDAVRDDLGLRRCPVIVLSTVTDAETIASCHDGRANAYLTKPADREAVASLADAIDTFWLERAQLPSTTDTR